MSGEPGLAATEAVIFDLGGVIINLDNALTEKAFAALGAKEFARHFGHGFAASFFREYELGNLTDRQFIDEVKRMLGTEVGDAEVIDAWNALLLDFPPERIELLKTLRRRYRLFLFSNTNALHLEALHKIYQKTFGPGSIDDHFEKTYYSHILRLRKPDRESFEYIIRENQLDPSTTLFVDDALVNVEGSRAAGLQGYYLEKGMSIMDLRWEMD